MPAIDVRHLGAYIREQREGSKISLRELAKTAGVSNPYLSQIERGLRKPSAEVLQQLASALRVSTPVMYLRAGLLDALDAKEGHGTLATIAADPELMLAQKQSLSQIYETFRRENAREADNGATVDEHLARPDHVPAHEPAPEAPAATRGVPKKKPAKKAARPVATK